MGRVLWGGHGEGAAGAGRPIPSPYPPHASLCPSIRAHLPYPRCRSARLAPKVRRAAHSTAPWAPYRHARWCLHALPPHSIQRPWVGRVDGRRGGSRCREAEGRVGREVRAARSRAQEAQHSTAQADDNMHARRDAPNQASHGPSRASIKGRTPRHPPTGSSTCVCARVCRDGSEDGGLHVWEASRRSAPGVQDGEGARSRARDAAAQDEPP